MNIVLDAGGALGHVIQGIIVGLLGVLNVYKNEAGASVHRLP